MTEDKLEQANELKQKIRTHQRVLDWYLEQEATKKSSVSIGLCCNGRIYETTVDPIVKNMLVHNLKRKIQSLQAEFNCL